MKLENKHNKKGMKKQIINYEQKSPHCGASPQFTAICLNRDSNKIYKMNRIKIKNTIKNLDNPENLTKILVQDKINQSSDKNRQ
jgi:hypothetical protein